MEDVEAEMVAASIQSLTLSMLLRTYLRTYKCAKYRTDYVMF